MRAHVHTKKNNPAKGERTDALVHKKKPKEHAQKGRNKRGAVLFGARGILRPTESSTFCACQAPNTTALTHPTPHHTTRPRPRTHRHIFPAALPSRMAPSHSLALLAMAVVGTRVSAQLLNQRHTPNHPPTNPPHPFPNQAFLTPARPSLPFLRSSFSSSSSSRLRAAGPGDDHERRQQEQTAYDEDKQRRQQPPPPQATTARAPTPTR